MVLEERLYGHPGCGERGRFGEEMTWGMQVFPLWLLVDSQGEEGAGDGDFFLSASVYFKVLWGETKLT